MAQEIERKFIVDTQALPVYEPGEAYLQGYLDPEQAEVRIRITPKGCKLTVKSRTAGKIRSEFEFPIDPAEGQALLETLGLKPFIEKHRTQVVIDGKTWEIDHFHGENDGLTIAEVELDHASEAVQVPAWAAIEVTGDPRFSNASLSQRPYSKWSAHERAEVISRNSSTTPDSQLS